MIYPKLQNAEFSDNKLHIKSIHISGDFINTARYILNQYCFPEGNDYSLDISLKNEEITADNKEKYYIKIEKNKAMISCFSRRGAFRGIHTFMKLIEKDELFTGKIEDYPLFPIRGYIEGFYGHIWEQKKRFSVMSLMAKHGFNTFYYAPKDDIYHREKWREEYPEKEYDELKTLFDFACENEFDFYWCIGPGLTYHYTDSRDFKALVNKIESVYRMGVRFFGLLLDDIPGAFQYEDDSDAFENISQAHAKLINELHSALKTLDENIKLTVCPTEYFGDEVGEYNIYLGNNIPSDVGIFRTGQEICSRVLTCRDSEEYKKLTSHKPLYWDNYPVNDCEMFQEMHLGPIRGREKELYKYCEGLISNVMEYAECSKIPLMTIGDYLWNPLGYCPEKSSENAHRELLGDKAESFKYIADHLQFSCLNRNGGSALMSDVFYRISFLINTGERERALREFSAYIEENKNCLAMLKDEKVPLFEELSKWTEKFEMCCSLLEIILKTQLSPTKENKAELKKLLERYNRDAVVLTGFCLRELGEKTVGEE